MIEKLVLKNFESHVNTTIEFNNGVFVLKGSSNSGKSGIFRALRFVILNEPSSDKFINYGADECSVALYVNGHVIERVKARNNKKNQYIVDGEVLEAFGVTVPQQVSDIIGINDINTEWQWDKKPFLISETGGYISQKFNDIMNLNLIDTSQKKMESIRRATMKDVEGKVLELKYKNTELDKYKDISKVEDLIPLLTNEMEEHLKKEVMKGNISHFIKSYVDEESTIATIQVIPTTTLEDVANLLKEFGYKVESRAGLNNVLDMANKCVNLLANLKVVKASDIEGFERSFTEFVTGYNKRDNLYEVLVSIDNVCKSLEDIVAISDRVLTRYETSIIAVGSLIEQRERACKASESIKGIFTYLKVLESDIECLKEEYKAIAPDICPLCGHEMNKELE